MLRTKAKHLRLTPDQMLLLDTVRQYLGTPTESEAGLIGIRVLGEQLIASYLSAGIHGHRCDLLLAALNAASEETGAGRPAYQIDPGSRQLLRWHPPSGEYRAVAPAVAAWLPST